MRRATNHGEASCYSSILRDDKTGTPHTLLSTVAFQELAHLDILIINIFLVTIIVKEVITTSLLLCILL
jgi:hypothetical protein